MAWKGGGPTQAAPTVIPPAPPDRQVQPPPWQQPPLQPPRPVQQQPPPQAERAGSRPAGRQRKNGRPSRRTAIKAGALLCAAAVVIVIAVTGTRPAGASVTASIKNFLLDWEQRHYAAAAAMTTGDPVAVASRLRKVYRQLGAQDLLLTMGPISVHGSQAKAFFDASIDLGRGGLSWHYTGSFQLRRTAAGWQVVWSPSVVVPGLGTRDRLAVLTTMPRRAVLLNAQGRSLIRKSRVVQLGVIPGQVTSPLRTAQRLAKVTGLPPSDADEMSGQIEAWLPRSFLELVQLSPGQYGKLRRALRGVPGLKRRWRTERLFDSAAPVITGQVATETAKTLIEDGEPYRPGTTVGLNGLQQAYQAKLAGKPTTEVVMQNAKGKQVRVLHRWPGSTGSDVRTTISGSVQLAARNALSGVGLSAAIIAVRAGGGQILAVARHTKQGTPAVSPLGGRYQPGQSFTIVSTAALLAAKTVNAKSPEPCYRHNSAVGQGFANIPSEPNLGSQRTFRDVFAHACSTAFVALSLRLTPHQLTTAAEKLGIGGPPWKLPLPSFPGRITNSGSSTGELAADTIGRGSVLVSPLDMALVAGAVDSGTWRAPLLVTGPPTQRPAPRKIGSSVVRQLRDLMHSTVKSGAAKAADVPGGEVFGQVGTAPSGHHGLRAIWFVGFRGKVAFAVVVFARSASFAPAVQIASQFAAGLPSGS
jgi:cell division protein FtsI/penicillin-binding protein 2